MATHASLISAWDDQGGAIAPLGGVSRWSRMAGRQSGIRAERLPAATLVIAVHALAIALVMFSHTASPLAATPGLVAFDVPHGAAQPRRQVSRPQQRSTPRLPPVAVLPVPVASADAIPTVDVAAPDVTETASPVIPAATGGGCDLTQPVQDALRNSDDVRRQLPTIPAGRRSVANAVVVWNAGWTAPVAGPAQAAFAVVRQTIMQTVAASSPECRNQLQRGPRLLFLPGATGANPAAPAAMTVLALGSGRWTWQQLVDGGQPLSGAVLATTEQPPAQFAIVRAAAAPGAPTPELSAMLAALIHPRLAHQQAPLSSYYP